MKRSAYFLLLFIQIVFLPYSYSETKTTGKELIAEQIAHPETTYEKFLPLAINGNAKIQNVLGYMYFYGEGVLQDYNQAHTWFHNAAEQDYLYAKKNLAIFHSGIIKDIPKKYINLEETNKWLLLFEENTDKLVETGIKNQISLEEKHEDVINGEQLFVQFCAGCHGFNGIAYYTVSPSFALGERLHKSDSELCNSITNGKNIMPSWKNKLSEKQILNIIAFIRTLPVKFQLGIIGNLRNKPGKYFRFRPLGENGDEWNDADPVGYPSPN